MPLCRWFRMKKQDRAVILACNFLATSLVWLSFILSSWVEIELPGDTNVLVSALFTDCSRKVCWMPEHKPTFFILGGIFMISALLLSFCLNFLLLTFPPLFPETQKQYLSCAFTCIATGTLVFLSLLMHYVQILEEVLGPDPPKVTYKLPYLINLSSSALFLLSGALCLRNSQCFGTVGVLKSRPRHMDTISSEETDLDLKPSRKCERGEEEFPPTPGDPSAAHTYSSSCVTDSGKT